MGDYVQSGWPFLVLVAIIGASTVHCCDVPKVTPCVTDYMSSVNASVIYQSEETITQFCNGEVLKTFTDCVKEHTSDCEPMVRMAFEGPVETTKLQCTTGKAEALKHGPCLDGKENVQELIGGCLKTFMTDVASADNKCREIEKFLNCTDKVATEQCGAESASYQAKVSRLSIKALMDQQKCNIQTTDTTSNGGENGSAMIVGSFALVWLTTILFQIMI